MLAYKPARILPLLLPDFDLEHFYRVPLNFQLQFPSPEPQLILMILSLQTKKNLQRSAKAKATLKFKVFLI